MDCSTPGVPVHHQLPEFTQTHVHRVGDAIQHLILCRPLLLLPSVFPSIRVFSNESVFHIMDTLLNEKVLLCVSFSLITLRSLLSDPHTAKDFEKLLFTYLSIPVPEPVSHCLVSELILI